MLRYLVIAMLVAACGGDDGTVAHHDAAVDADMSTCGHPGDLGNELGIGHFCETLSDCTTTPSARLCSKIGDSSTHFCTKTCTMGSTDQCGTDASCTCNSSNQCGCTPNSCLGP